MVSICAVILLLGLFCESVEAAPPAKKTKAPARPAVALTQTVSDAAVAQLVGKPLGTIEFTGLKRIEKDAVLAKLVTKVGQELSRENIRTDIKAIHAMGFFDDIEVSGELAQNGTVSLTFVIKERPVISELDFEGNERITTEDLQEVVKVKQWAILDINQIKEDVARIQKHYEEKGFYLAKVSFEVKPGESKDAAKDEVKLVFKIRDFEKVQIKKITFLNNRNFSDRQLKALLMETREGGFFSFASGAGNFKESAFKQDLQRLTYWYLDHGFIKFRYENPIVTVSDDKRWLYISIYLDEGDKYQIGEVDFSGDLLFEKDELKTDLVMRSGEQFSISKRNSDIQALTEKYQDLGYAFVNVVPKMAIQDDKKLVELDYGFEKGNLVHFGEITVVGNSKTYDKVVRREIKINEGELYSGSKLRESRENVERLGFFAPGEVIFNTVTPKDQPDVLNVEISVKERSTGTITLGAGYGSVQKFFLTTQISEINLMGRGQSLSLSGNYSADRVSRSINLGFTDPYAFDTRWSTGFDVFAVNAPIPGKYLTRKLGFDVRLGHPIGDYTNVYFTYKNEGLRITEVENVGTDTTLDSGVLSSVVGTIVRDKRNNRFEATAGNYQSASIETAGLGPLNGDKQFLKLVLNNRYYTRVIGDLVFRNSFELGHVDPMGGVGVPPAERFFLGGPNSLKGFQYFSVGPTQVVNGVTEPQGGLVQLLGLFELEYPLVREAGLKTVLFYDAGNSFRRLPGSEGEPFTIRSDWGFGIRWFSPIGPLRFEWGFPFKPRPGENTTEFQFFIGPPF